MPGMQDRLADSTRRRLGVIRAPLVPWPSGIPLDARSASMEEQVDGRHPSEIRARHRELPPPTRADSRAGKTRAGQ